MSRMFLIPHEGIMKPMTTWNVQVGCLFECAYCSARKAALTRLKHSERYAEGFKPALIPELLTRRFKPGQFVFVGYMGDISFADRPTVGLILGSIRHYPGTDFLFCSKDPGCFARWGFEYPKNLYLGTTIETNFDFGLSKAPAPEQRYEAMRDLDHPRKFVSIEPLMDFHLRTLVDWIKEIRPGLVEIGGDNYHNNLPEPCDEVSTLQAPWKVRWLLEELREFCPCVVEKDGLDRLKGDKSND